MCFTGLGSCSCFCFHGRRLTGLGSCGSWRCLCFTGLGSCRSWHGVCFTGLRSCGSWHHLQFTGLGSCGSWHCCCCSCCCIDLECGRSAKKSLNHHCLLRVMILLLLLQECIHKVLECCCPLLSFFCSSFCLNVVFLLMLHHLSFKLLYKFVALPVVRLGLCNAYLGPPVYQGLHCALLLCNGLLMHGLQLTCPAHCPCWQLQGAHAGQWVQARATWLGLKSVLGILGLCLKHLVRWAAAPHKGCGQPRYLRLPDLLTGALALRGLWAATLVRDGLLLLACGCLLPGSELHDALQAAEDVVPLASKTANLERLNLQSENFRCSRTLQNQPA